MMQTCDYINCSYRLVSRCANFGMPRFNSHHFSHRLQFHLHISVKSWTSPESCHCHIDERCRYSIIVFRPDGTYCVVRPESFHSFPDFFLAIFSVIAWKLGLLFCSEELQFQFVFRCDWYIFARVTPFRLRGKKKNFSVFRIMPRWRFSC
jgi:hypothetical protein